MQICLLCMDRYVEKTLKEFEQIIPAQYLGSPS